VQEVATLFRMPSNCSVLQWEFSTRMCGSSLEFRATVAFLLDGVPHHVAGIWKLSKKLAQRDAAERALELYAKVDGEALEQENYSLLVAAAELREEQPWFVATGPEDVVWSVPIPARLAAATKRTRECLSQSQAGGGKEPLFPKAPAAEPPWPRLALERGPALEVPFPHRLLPELASASALTPPSPAAHDAPQRARGGEEAAATVEPCPAPPGLGGEEAAATAPPYRPAPPGLEAFPPGLGFFQQPDGEDAQDEVDLLKDFCDEMGWPAPRFSFKLEGGRCQAMVEMLVLGVLHTFAGQLCDDHDVAEVDVARRVLWYLRAPGREDAFEPDEDYARRAAQVIPEPPKADWVKDGVWEDKLAERKTTIMLVQNRLQQAFARQIEAGVSVWHWSYERDHRSGLPPLIRATVTVPLAGRYFVGNWMHGQRDAQIDTCSKVVEFLDEEYPRP